MIFAQCDSDEIESTLLIIVLEADNLQRMEKADPITLEVGVPGSILRPIKYPNRVRLLIAYEKDAGRIYQMIREGRDPELLQHLMRGYSYTKLDGGVALRVPKEGA
jgi:hypothetical protein